MPKQGPLAIVVSSFLLLTAVVPAESRTAVRGPEGGFARRPLAFIPNRGQADERVAFYLPGNGQTVYFTSEGVTFLFSNAGGSGNGDTALKPPGAGRGAGSPERWAMKLDFMGANPDAGPVGREETGARVSYFRGKPEEWRRGIPTYSRIVYPDLWPGIDLVYYGTAGTLKYDFIIEPGADPSLIRLAYRGASAVAVNGRGRLEVRTPAGGFEDDRPVAYQVVGGEKRVVAIAYRLEERPAPEPGPADREAAARPFVYGFEVGPYDRTEPLVLDPAILVYCGYIGGAGVDHGQAVAVDGRGNAYVTGYTSSDETGFPVAAGPDPTHNGGEDVFVAKVSGSGSDLVYCGYIGGPGIDRGLGIAVDGAGCAYVTGTTSSPEAGFPVAGGPDLTFNGGSEDAFVAKLNASGTDLLYCGYIGGSNDVDIGQDIEVDGPGNAYVTGYTASDQTTFPVAVGPDLTHNGYQDAFVAKVNPSGSALVYCGYIGGSNSDWGMGIAVDDSGNAYVGGDTYSTEKAFPVAVGPDLTHNGTEDAFVAKVNAAGTGLVYCGFIGGQGRDQGMALAIDRSGNCYLTGPTYSTEVTFPVAGGPALTHKGGRDVYVAKVNASGTGLVYCGYIGGTDDEDISRGLAVDAAENAYVTGYTYSTEVTFPVAGGPDLTHNGQRDAFLAKVSASGTTLIHCGYVGGEASDWAFGVAVDGAGNAYVAGDTSSTQASFPVAGGPDLTHNGGDPAIDAFVAKIPCWDVWAPRHAVGDLDALDGADEAALDFGTLGVRMYDDGSWIQLANENAQFLAVGDVDADGLDELLADFGPLGLRLWDAGAWSQLSGADIEGLAVGDADADGAGEIIADFGSAGAWLWNGGGWSRLSAVNAENLTVSPLDESGAAEIVGDFGGAGVWLWNAGGWSELSGVNADHLITGRAGPTGRLTGDFGPSGLWQWSSAGGWLQLSGDDADDVVTANTDGDPDDELIGDFGAAGLWSYDGGLWTQLSGANADVLIAADTTGDGVDGLAVDFGALGLWLIEGGSWSQLTGLDAEHALAADTDGDAADEVLADFGPLGLWLWDAGSWSRISANSPD